MNKLATAFGGLLMIGAVLAPLAMAHGDSGSHNDTVGLPAPAGYNSGGSTPSGFYYGSVSAWAQLTAFSAGTVGPVPGPVCPTSVAQIDAILCALVLNLDPGFTLAAANALCDMEVSGPGSAGFPTDEKTIDGKTGGSAPDGTFNDGGVGAVCHVPDGFYADGDYNTNGCGSASASAKDLVSASIWISASCDSTTPVATDGLLTQVLSTESCAVNNAISGSPQAIQGCVEYLVDCLAPTAQPGSPCAGTSGVTCEADGVADLTTDGDGSAAYPGYAGTCTGAAGTTSSEATFVWNSVQVTVNPDGSLGDHLVSAATTGWVQ